VSAVVLLLAAGLAPGDGPGAVSAEVAEGFEFPGEWECVQFNGSVFTYSGTAAGSTYIQTFGLTPEGAGKLRLCPRGRALLGIYQWKGDSFIACFRAPDCGRPTTFDAGDGQRLLILRRIPPGK
jgi:hypothetical protein